LKRKFFTNISLLLVLNIIIKAFWVLGIDRSVQNLLGADDYGFYFSLFSFSVLFTILLDFGITNYNNRSISGDPSLITGMIGNIFLIRLAFAILYVIVSLVIAGIIGYSGRQMSLLYILMVNQFLASFILYLRSNITALQLFRIDSFLSVTDRLIMIIICSLLLWGGITERRFRIEWFVYCQTAGYGITFLISLALVLSRGAVRSINFSTSQILAILKGSAPFALLALFMSVYWRIDTVMLERILPDGTVQSGIYAQSFRLLDAAAMIPYLFAVILLPMYSKMISSQETVSGLVRFSAILMIIPAIVTAIVSVVYPYEIMDLLYVGHVDESSVLLAILMCGYVPVSLVYLFSTLLTALGKLKIMNFIAAGGMFLNILLNFIMIPNWHAKGSALATVITQGVMCGLFIFFAVRSTRIRFDKSFIYQIISYIIILIGLTTGLRVINVPALVSVSIIGFAGLLFPFVLRLIRWPDLAAMIYPNSK